MRVPGYTGDGPHACYRPRELSGRGGLRLEELGLYHPPWWQYRLQHGRPDNERVRTTPMSRTVVLSACRHAKKARINSEDVLADAFEKTYKRLKDQVKDQSDLDSDIQVGSQACRNARAEPFCP